MDCEEFHEPKGKHWQNADSVRLGLESIKFPMKNMYEVLNDDNNRVPWRNLLRCNRARHRGSLCLWLACHGKLATKDRLKRFGMLQDSQCGLSLNAEEFINHLFFECRISNAI